MSDQRAQPLALSTTGRGIEQAARLTAFGQLVGASFGSVFGVVGGGRRPETATAVAAVKGQRRIGKPLSMCLPAEDFARLIDPGEVAPRLRTWVKDGRSLAHTLSSLCFVRAPIRKSVAAVLPEHLISLVGTVPYLQNVDPSGVPAVRRLIHRLHDRGIMPAVTSMNVSGQPTITKLDEAERFVLAQHVPALLSDPRAHLRARDPSPSSRSARRGSEPSGTG